MSKKNFEGNRFGKLVVIRQDKTYITPSGQKKITWLCQCDCGNQKVIRSSNLARGKTNSCGCIRRSQLLGKRFGYLLVTEYLGTNNGKTLWKCKCDCGEEVVKEGIALTKGSVRSCGCLVRKLNKEKAAQNAKHGMTKTRIYKIWQCMKNRCRNSNLHEYQYYGGRGIKVCKEWNDFLPFYEWAISNGYSEKLTLDRLNVDGDYEPSNCRWISIQEQQLNKRNNQFITYKGETKTVTEWSREKEISLSTLRHRLFVANWSIEKALETPPDSRLGRRKGA